MRKSRFSEEMGYSVLGCDEDHRLAVMVLASMLGARTISSGRRACERLSVSTCLWHPSRSA
jgi:hypothetical protein